jgi:drug/metabolite transporter (DMT)-like permease
MLRLIFKWIAVISLAGFGLDNGVDNAYVYLCQHGDWNWNAIPEPVDSAMTLAGECLGVTAALSSAVYIVLLERHLRLGTRLRGFDVTTPTIG